jgi:alanine dehydrogenase
MKIGVLWKSNKENEKRYPIHHKHISELSLIGLQNLFFEEGYPLGEIDLRLINIMSRKSIFESCDLIILPKPTKVDLDSTKRNQILWGWPHAVQGFEITDYALKKDLTLIAWENMFVWSNNNKKEHIFARNNEIAGYASVNHFMELTGLTPGIFGEELKIAVLGHGSTAKGAINCLVGLGASDITVYSKRNKFQINDAIKNIKYRTYSFSKNKIIMNKREPKKELINYDLIVNCVLQNPSEPVVFLTEKDLKDFKKKIYIIDISCDKGMGFDFAVPTSFNCPLIESKYFLYYAVDHTPTYYWNASSFEISGALLPYLKYILENKTYKGNIVLEKAVDIENGIIKNKEIIKFQNR